MGLKTGLGCSRDTHMSFTAPFILTIIHLTHRYSEHYVFSLFFPQSVNGFQDCFILMKVETRDKKSVRLIPKELNMLENVDLTLFFIEGWNLDFRNQTKPRDRIWMTMSLKRKIMSEMMTTYLPSILLMMITFATTFFKPVYVEAALTVNLTNMLVMTTIFISVMERLPTTSYLKMIDLWLIFCQLIPFTEVITDRSLFAYIMYENICFEGNSTHCH